jgi:membrane protein
LPAFGWYVTTFNSYEKTYGPLAGVIALILWLQLSSFAVPLGCELNAELERQAAETGASSEHVGGAKE